MTKIRDLLYLPPVERQLLRIFLAHVTGLSHAQLLSRDDTELSREQEAAVYAMLTQAQSGVPVAYIVGVKEFFSHKFKVTQATLIPRPETELLVEEALALAPLGANIADLGTGSGCIAISLKLARPDLSVVASDFSLAALDVARANALNLGAPVEFLCSDWFSAFSVERQFDLIVSNPPYIAQGDVHLIDLALEPQSALSDGADGLSCIRKIVARAGAYLKPGGWLLIEHGYDQGAQVREIFGQQQFNDVSTLCDLAGIERLCVGQYRR